MIQSRQRQHADMCSISGCDNPYRGRGWCQTHYMRWYHFGNPIHAVRATCRTCSIPDCDRPYFARSWCSMHYARWQRHDNPLKRLREPVAKGTYEVCAVEGCGKPFHSTQLCHNHYRQFISKPKRRAQETDVRVNDFTPEQWQQALENHNYTCAYCGASAESLTQDHVTPISRGGNHTAANIVPACGSCNSRKHNSIGKYIPARPSVTVLLES